jgi:hypothetical protein
MIILFQAKITEELVEDLTFIVDMAFPSVIALAIDCVKAPIEASESSEDELVHLIHHYSLF